MTRKLRGSGISRRAVLSTAAVLPILSTPLLRTSGLAQTSDPLPSWNNGVAKETIIGFVQATVDRSSRTFVPPEARIATFDQDGTLWVEHPMYTQVMYCLERVPDLVKAKPELKNKPPFNTVLELLHGDRVAMEKLNEKDLEVIAFATLFGMSVD